MQKNKQVWLDARRHLNRKAHFSPDLAPLDPNLGHKFFLEVSALLMLDTLPNCNSVQYQRKLKMQPWENSENPNLGPNFEPPIFFHEFYLY